MFANHYWAFRAEGRLITGPRRAILHKRAGCTVPCLLIPLSKVGGLKAQSLEQEHLELNLGRAPNCVPQEG